MLESIHPPYKIRRGDEDINITNITYGIITLSTWLSLDEYNITFLLREGTTET